MFNYTKDEAFHYVAGIDKAASFSGHGMGIFQAYCHLNSKLMPSLLNWLNKEQKATDMCAGYQQLWWTKFLIGNTITIFVQVMNLVIKFIV